MARQIQIDTDLVRAVAGENVTQSIIDNNGLRLRTIRFGDLRRLEDLKNANLSDREFLEMFLIGIITSPETNLEEIRKWDDAIFINNC